MKIARFSVDGQVRYGIVNGEELSEIRGSIYKKFKVTDIKHNLKNVVLLPPTNPSEIWCPGLNFANHLEYAAEVLGEENPTVPEHPEPWIKARSSLTGTGNPIILPVDSSGEVHYEGEAVTSSTLRDRGSYKYFFPGTPWVPVAFKLFITKLVGMDWDKSRGEFFRWDFVARSAEKMEIESEESTTEDNFSLSKPFATTEEALEFLGKIQPETPTYDEDFVRDVEEYCEREILSKVRDWVPK